jgi:hypothetical protein
MSANEFSPLGSRIFNQYEGGRPEKDCLESAGNALSLFAKTAFGRDIKIGKDLKETTAPCALRILAGIVAVILAPITFIGLLLTRLSPTHAKANSIANKILRKQNKNAEKPAVQKDPREAQIQVATPVQVENKPAVVQLPVSKDNSPESDKKDTQDEAANKPATLLPVVETKEPSPAPATLTETEVPPPVEQTAQTATKEVKAPSPRPTSPRPQDEQILVGEGADLRALFYGNDEETTAPETNDQAVEIDQTKTTVTIDTPVEEQAATDDEVPALIPADLPETEGTETQEEVVEGEDPAQTEVNADAKPEIETGSDDVAPTEIEEEQPSQVDLDGDKAILIGSGDTEPLDNPILPQDNPILPQGFDLTNVTFEEEAEKDSVSGDDHLSVKSDASGDSVNVHDVDFDEEGSSRSISSDESSNSGESEGDSE